MSIRIHKLAEELGLDNKEMITLLKERKIIAQDVKSVSSTVDNISASALREEFAATRPAPAAPAPVEKPVVEVPPPPPKVSSPSGIFVKSKEDIDREHEAAAAAKLTMMKSATPVVAPAPRPAALPPASPR